MPAAKLLTNGGVQHCSFDFTNASLEKPLTVGLMEPGLWPVVPDEFESGGEGHLSSAKRRKKIFATVSTVWPQFVVCSSRCHI